MTGAYPEVDTAIADPIAWYTAVPATASVDGHFTTENYFAAGL
ncbi:MAG: hypothetical protein WD556_04610 [Actinomycetota bacterium]